MTIACVLGTFNRKSYLVNAIRSVRDNAGESVTFIVVDGGSQDGSREWLATEPDVVLIGQQGELTGPVRAFNLGFRWAVENDFDYVLHFNDDAKLATPSALTRALEHMEDPAVGAVAFRFDLFKAGFDTVHGKTYSNFGLLRTSACIAAAEAMGDPTGTKWWNPIYRCYGADSELGAWLWKLGYQVVADEEIRVEDLNCKDALRKNNEAKSPGRSDSKLFWSRWLDPESVLPFKDAYSMRWGFKRLHLGCGDKRLPETEGWINVDGVPSPATDVVGDAFAVLRAIPKSSLKEIYSSHFVEHIAPDRLPELFSLMYRAMASTGELRIATTDLKGIYENRFLSAKNGSAWNSALFGETESRHSYFQSHKQCFTTETLCAALSAAGFRDVETWSIDDVPQFVALNDYALSCKLVTCYARGRK